MKCRIQFISFTNSTPAKQQHMQSNSLKINIEVTTASINIEVTTASEAQTTASEAQKHGLQEACYSTVSY